MKDAEVVFCEYAMGWTNSMLEETMVCFSDLKCPGAIKQKTYPKTIIIWGIKEENIPLSNINMLDITLS